MIKPELSWAVEPHSWAVLTAPSAESRHPNFGLISNQRRAECDVIAWVWRRTWAHGRLYADWWQTDAGWWKIPSAQSSAHRRVTCVWRYLARNLSVSRSLKIQAAGGESGAKQHSTSYVRHLETSLMLKNRTVALCGVFSADVLAYRLTQNILQYVGWWRFETARDWCEACMMSFKCDACSLDLGSAEPNSAQEPAVSRERNLAHCGNNQTNLAGALGAHILRGFLLDLCYISLFFVFT